MPKPSTSLVLLYEGMEPCPLTDFTPVPSTCIVIEDSNLGVYSVWVDMVRYEQYTTRVINEVRKRCNGQS